MKENFQQVFAELEKTLRPYADKLVCVTDVEDCLYVDTPFVMKNKKPLFFASVQIEKNYVSYHLMPVYVNPGLLVNTSEPLRKRMQGKSCFNFKMADKDLLQELKQLTKDGYAFYKQAGYI